jgi:hypothetical protein
MNSRDDDALLYLEIKLQALIRRVEAARGDLEQTDRDLQETNKKGTPMIGVPSVELGGAAVTPDQPT